MKVNNTKNVINHNRRVIFFCNKNVMYNINHNPGSVCDKYEKSNVMISVIKFRSFFYHSNTSCTVYSFPGSHFYFFHFFFSFFLSRFPTQTIKICSWGKNDFTHQFDDSVGNRSIFRMWLKRNRSEKKMAKNMAEKNFQIT